MTTIEKLVSEGVVYLLDSCETDAVLKIMNTKEGVRVLVKFKGKPEYSVRWDSNIAHNATLCGHQITKDEYDNY